MLIRKLRSLRVEYALEELLNVDIRSTFSKPTSIEKKIYIQVSFWNWNRATTTQYKFRSQSTQATYTKLIFSFLLFKNSMFFNNVWKLYVPRSLLCCFSSPFSYWIFFYFSSYTMPLLQNAQGGKEEKKMRKSTLAIYIEWLELSFMMSMKAGMRRNQENQEGKKYKYISIFFADTRFFFLHCCCCSSSIRNQNIYQQWNENGMDRWLQINENKNILVLVYDMQVP